MSEGISEASAAKKKEIGKTISSRILYWVLLPYYAYCKQDLSIQHGGRDEHTYTTKQFKSAKSTTYQALQN
jgi:hypothetical protein